MPDILSSPTNPNGLLEMLSSRQLEDLDTYHRVLLAIADTKSFLVEVAGLDLDMAEVAAARSSRELLGALGIKVSDEEINNLIRKSSELSDAVAVDRAIHMMLPDSE
jgi:hypothetical protein